MIRSSFLHIWVRRVSIYRLLFLISTIGFVVILCVCLWWGLLLWIYFGMCNLCLLERNKSVKSEISSCTYNMGNYFLPSMGVGCRFIIWNSSLGFIKDLLCILRICHDMQNFKTFWFKHNMFSMMHIQKMLMSTVSAMVFD